MTIKELKEELNEQYAECEVYKSTDKHSRMFHMFDYVNLDNCSPYGNYTEDMEVESYELMDEDEYNNSILANGEFFADFNDLYDDKNAKVLCIFVK